jgi:hypothetical protein
MTSDNHYSLKGFPGKNASHASKLKGPISTSGRSKNLERPWKEPWIKGCVL